MVAPMSVRAALRQGETKRRRRAGTTQKIDAEWPDQP